jgi:error-prone DNA polymerase
MTYAELQVTTSYSFLRGASHPEELFAEAALLGLPALGVCDRASFAGIVRAWQASRTTGVRLVVGTRLDLSDGTALLAYPTDRAAYSRLCRLLTLGKSRAGKGGCDLAWDDLLAHAEGTLAILLANEEATLPARLARLRHDFGDRGYLAISLQHAPDDAARLRRLEDAAQAAHVPTVATNDVLYHVPDRRPLQDVVTCIREGCRIDDAGFRRERSADRFLKPPVEIARLFRRHPEAVGRSTEIVSRCRFDLGELRYQYPDEIDDPDLTPQQTLDLLTWQGAERTYPEGVPAAVRRQLTHELALIAEMEYAPYFLTVNNIVRHARSQGILCQGRGSAANSAVCYVLGITAIDPVRGNLLFERFISTERREPPDIDVDFEHERREEVIQWVYNTYGHQRAALCATVTRFRARGAMREVGKVLGLTEDVTGALSGQVWGWSREGVSEDNARDLNLNADDRRLRLAMELARELIGFPRHLGQHPGGFVLTRDRLDDLVPIEPAAMVNRQVIEWDKDDVEALRFMKVDVLGLGMLGCMRRAFDLLEARTGERLSFATIPPEDPATYEMIQRADTLGVFQIESRAQMSMLPRLRPATFYDLVIEVAVVRPGPIQGDMVHPYLRRRQGLEAAEYPTPELRGVLEKTLGVPLFQEQAMKVAMVCAGFSPSEADQLRRSMATFKLTGGVSHFADKLINGMIANGYTAEFAARTFRQIEGFGSYGFPESHAASFALIAYASSWMKCHHPDIFACALLNAQPMGFYAPAQIVRDARAHGVQVRSIDINHSRWDSTLEPNDGPRAALRLGLRMAKGLANDDGARIAALRGDSPYASLADVARRAGVSASALERLAEADAYGSMGIDRRAALWAVRALEDDTLPLFAAAGETLNEPAVSLPAMKAGREVVEDYQSIGLTLRRHPVGFLRAELQRREMRSCAGLDQVRDGQRVTVAGIVLVRQRPGSAKGVLFITIEDETGHANLIVWPTLFDQQRSLILSAGMIGCAGRLQREGLVTHVVAERLTDLSDLLASVGEQDSPFPLRQGRGDEAKHGGAPDQREPLPARPPRDIYPPTMPGRIKVHTRDFR